MTLDIREIEVALQEAIFDLGLVSAGHIAYPGMNVSVETLPRLELDFVSRFFPVVDAEGYGETENGRLAVTICTEKDEGNAAASAIFQSLYDTFRPGAKVALPSAGSILFTQFANPDRGFEDEASWRLPVTLTYTLTP